MSDVELGLFDGKDKPTVETAWNLYQNGLSFNLQINLDDTVKSNENFYIGKQWEGVQSNGLPTPQVNILKRVVGFIVATISSENIKVNATALAASPDKQSLIEPVRIVNEAFEALNEANDVPSLVREFARNSAVDGDGCMYTYWDADEDAGDGVKGAIKTEILSNTRVFFGNPNDKDVQAQPFIQIASREIVRNTKKKAKDNGIETWTEIKSDSDESNASDHSKYTSDKVTVLLTLWRDDDTGEIWAYESTHNSTVKKPWSLNIKTYPICWLPWDYIQDCYHGQAMITGLIPNQMFINKSLAMSQLSIMRTAFPKVLFNKAIVSSWDNRVGAAIGIVGGDIDKAAKIIDPATISPQISQYIQMTIDMTEQSLGATSVALGDTRPDNTSAILALQRAAATPSEMTKQNLYKSVESLFRIYFEFMAEYYGTRNVGIAPPPKVVEAAQFTGDELPEEIPVQFDFESLKKIPMRLKIDVGASSYYSEIASRQTLDNLLMNKLISVEDYLERIPDSYIPRRRALIAKIKEREQAQLGMAQGAPQNDGTLQAPPSSIDDMEIKGGRGNSKLQRTLVDQIAL